ncbi:MAG: hypothetical protein HON90_07630, partial [Halobacteriovoraceae bacterium]|nr:hypothetical protein [Halobacteriovoraceae bacterium]
SMNKVNSFPLQNKLISLSSGPVSSWYVELFLKDQSKLSTRAKDHLIKLLYSKDSNKLQMSMSVLKKHKVDLFEHEPRLFKIFQDNKNSKNQTKAARLLLFNTNADLGRLKTIIKKYINKDQSFYSIVRDAPILETTAAKQYLQTLLSNSEKYVKMNSLNLLKDYAITEPSLQHKIIQLAEKAFKLESEWQLQGMLVDLLNNFENVDIQTAKIIKQKLGSHNNRRLKKYISDSLELQVVDRCNSQVMLKNLIQ